MPALPDDPQPPEERQQEHASDADERVQEADIPPAPLDVRESVPADAPPPEPPDSVASIPAPETAASVRRDVDASDPSTDAAPDTERTGVAPAISPPAAPPTATVIDVRDLNWDAIRRAVAEPITGERAERIIGRMEERFAGGAPIRLAFDEHRAGSDDQVIHVRGEDDPGDIWFVGDLHGDLLALEAALQQIERSGAGPGTRIVFLGDLFDDGPYGAEVVLRIWELLLDGPASITVLAGNHDEALRYDGMAFHSSVVPSDFTEWLNAHIDEPWVVRLGEVIIRFFEVAPRAIFFPDGLLAAHGGVPHTDLHAELEETQNWNDPRVLQDFVWTRAHPRARKRIPNRTTRGCEFGRDDLAAFCDLATRLGRRTERMIRGHDHVEERFAVFSAYTECPILTIVTLSHRLPRELFGPYERVPCIARRVRDQLPDVHRLHLPPELVHQVYPEAAEVHAPSEPG